MNTNKPVNDSSGFNTSGLNSAPYMPPQNGNKNFNAQASFVPYKAPMSVREKVLKKNIKVSLKDIIFAALTLVLCIFGVRATFFDNFFKLGFTVTYALYFALSTIYVFKKGKVKFSIYGTVCGILALAGSGVFAVYTDKLICFLLLCAILMLNSLYLLNLSKSALYTYKSFLSLIDVVKFLFYIPFAFFIPTFAVLLKSKNKKGKNFTRILIGILCAVPIAGIAIALLSSSDAAFEGVIKLVFRNIGTTIATLIMGIIAFPFIFSPLFALRHGLLKGDNVFSGADKVNSQKLNTLTGNTVLCVISLVYLVYMFSQLAYFFNAFSGIIPKDFSACTYARRGFFEMCAIAFINLVIVFLSLLLFKRRDDLSVPVLSKVLLIFISSFSILLISTALSKMYLYIHLYGLTYKRLLTSIFMVVLIMVFICCIVKILVKKFPYMAVILVFSSLVLVVTGYADISATCAKYNTYAYSHNLLEEDDTTYLNDLQSSSIPYIVELIGDKNRKIANPVESYIYDTWFEVTDSAYNLKTDKSLFGYNYSRKKTLKELEKVSKKYRFKEYAKYYDDSLVQPDGMDYCYNIDAYENDIYENDI